MNSQEIEATFIQYLTLNEKDFIFLKRKHLFKSKIWNFNPYKIDFRILVKRSLILLNKKYLFAPKNENRQ